jgi:3-methyladenine DNA glycosylase AlkC
MRGLGITDRLKVAGREIAAAVKSFEHAEFVSLAKHRSDLVRQWTCYAVNDPFIEIPLDSRLGLTQGFAMDSNMSVREAAWMAFRPHLALNLREGIRLLEGYAAAEDANLRRFSIEVTRPRSVWGSHIGALKQTPRLCQSLLERVKRDESRYVRLAAGNWLNDASKSQPTWVLKLCQRWSALRDPRTDFIVKRGLRTIAPGMSPVAATESQTSQGPASFGERLHALARREVC